MRLKTRLLIQNVVIIAVTVAVTAFSAYTYIRISREFSKTAGVLNPIVISEEDGKAVSTGKLSEAQVKSILMDISAGAQTVSCDGAHYTVLREKAEKNSLLYVLSPISDYSGALIFSTAVFLITLTVCLFITGLRNKKNIITPLCLLKDTTTHLTDGNINVPVESMGNGELAELFDSMEELRLKLREAVFYREKYDDNRKFLISGISHDLRTPVTAIRGYIEGVLDGVAGDEAKKRRYLETALVKTDIVNEMIDDLLLYSKLDLGKIPFELCRVDMAEYLKNCVSENIQEFERQGKSLTFECNCESPVVTTDPSRFKRVIQNILSNAMKNTSPENGAVKIMLRETPQSIIIEIKDNGKGIKEEDIPHVFDRFFRGDSARSGGGSGLGLTIAKQITEGLGGRIWAVGGENSGASFLISLKRIDGGKHEKNTDN